MISVNFIDGINYVCIELYIIVMNKILISLLLTLWGYVLNATVVHYTLSMPDPHTHYFEVTMTIKDMPQNYVDVKMPVWAPGSYLVREFSRNVENLSAKKGTELLNTDKINKNTWRVYHNKAKEFTVSYRVYAFELSVRTSFVDQSHGYINGTSVFLYVDGQLNASGNLTILPYKDWKTISTSLPKAGGFGQYTYPDYDVLVDSPIEIGNHFEFDFTASGCKHTVAMFGEGNYDVEKLKKDMAKIVETTTKVFGFNPNKEYVFIIHNLEHGSGGLEHASSTTLQVDRWGYQGNQYLGFLSLVAHEYFHLWNVKRIRAKELGPFDYDKEAFTSLLWIMEGFTTYYDELLLLRAGYYTPEQYLKKISSAITSIENQPGNEVLSLSESSLDAWIKLYRPNENSYNTTISYYTKGSVAAAMIDMKIIAATKGRKSLDDVLIYLYKEYYEKQKRGFTEEEARMAMEKVSGESFKEFFEKYINGTEPIPYEDFAEAIGLSVERYKVREDVPLLGIRTEDKSGSPVISLVIRNTSAYNSGLNVNDEIIAINGFRVTNSSGIIAITTTLKVGDKPVFTLIRDGKLLTIDVTMEPDPNKDVRIVKAETSSPLSNFWLRTF